MSLHRALGVLALAAVAATACTGDSVEASSDFTPRCSPGPGCRIVVESQGARYELECLAVPEALVDVDLPREPGRPVKAITGVAAVQGVAALWKDPDGCGLWVLGLVEGLSSETADALRDEMARGVERFGVTASPVPQEPGAE